MKITTKILYSQCDASGRLSIPAAAAMAQDLMIDLLEELGSDNITLKNKAGALWVIAKMKFCFFRMPKLDDTVMIENTVCDVTKIKMGISVRAHDVAGKVLWTAYQQCCPIDLASRRVRLIESVPFAKPAQTIKTAGNIFSVFDGEFPQEAFAEQRKVRYADTDYSHHTNNVSYVRFIFESLSGSFWTEKAVKSLEIHYRRESHEGEMLSIYQKTDEHKTDILMRCPEREIIRARLEF